MYHFEDLLPSFPVRDLIHLVDKLCIIDNIIITGDFIYHIKGYLSEFCLLCTFRNACLTCLVNYGPEAKNTFLTVAVI